MSGITIENGSVKIPIEAVEGDGLVVLTLAPGAYLIIRHDALANYPREKLAELERLVREISPEPEFPSVLSPEQSARVERTPGARYRCFRRRGIHFGHSQQPTPVGTSA